MGIRNAARRLGVAMGALALAGAGIVAAALPAAAAQVDVVKADSIVITNESNTVNNVQWQTARITFDWDISGKGVTTGDSFTIELPPLFAGNAASFPILAIDNVTAIANCTVTSRPADLSTGGALTCVFTDYVTSHPTAAGDGWFRAQFAETTTNETTELRVNAVVEVVDLPGTGGVVPPTPTEQTEEEKWGWFRASAGAPNQLEWNVFVQGSQHPIDRPITVIDTFNPDGTHVTAYTLVPGSARMLYYPDQAAWLASTPVYLQPGSTSPVSWTFTPSATGFTAVIQNSNPDGIYRIQYRTDVANPDLIQPGMIFSNLAEIEGIDHKVTVRREPQGGGSGDGPGTGSFQIIKDDLEGGGAATVDPDLAFTVNASYVRNGVALTTDVDGATLPTSFQITAGGTRAVQGRLLTGTVVTLTEVLPADTAQQLWQTPVIRVYEEGDPAETTGTTVTFTIREQSRTTVEITNTVEGVPSVDIEKWSPAGAPTYDASGAVTNDGALGDYDLATAPETLDPLAPTTITFTVSNDGTEELVDLAVTDALTNGTGTITGLTCTFPDQTEGVTWAGPLAVGAQFTCTGTLPALGEDAIHADMATVTAVGATSRTEVTDEDPYHAITTTIPRVSVGDLVWEDLNKDGLQDAGEPGIPDVTLTLTGPGGGSVTDVLGNPVAPVKTNANGLYLFTDLPVLPDGQSYTVTVTPPAGYLPTVESATDDRELDSEAIGGVAVSWKPLAENGASDLTLDFGYVKAVPSVDIEKWSPAGAPTYDASGAVTNDGAKGDFDSALAPESLDPLKPTTITFTISNDGNEPLVDLKVSDALTSGTGVITGLTCTFPDGSKGVTWAGPLAVGERFTCTGALPALGAGAVHADRATVTAVGQISGTESTDTDDYHSVTPVAPPPTGADSGLAVVGAGGLLLLGVGMLEVARRRGRA